MVSSCFSLPRSWVIICSIIIIKIIIIMSLFKEETHSEHIYQSSLRPSFSIQYLQYKHIQSIIQHDLSGYFCSHAGCKCITWLEALKTGFLTIIKAHINNSFRCVLNVHRCKKKAMFSSFATILIQLIQCSSSSHVV